MKTDNKEWVKLYVKKEKKGHLTQPFSFIKWFLRTDINSSPQHFLTFDTNFMTRKTDSVEKAAWIFKEIHF